MNNPGLFMASGFMLIVFAIVIKGVTDVGGPNDSVGAIISIISFVLGATLIIVACVSTLSSTKELMLDKSLIASHEKEIVQVKHQFRQWNTDAKYDLEDESIIEYPFRS